VLDYLYEREMVTDVYRPRLVNIRAHQQDVKALTFIVERQHPQYAGRLGPDEAASAVRLAVGKSGRNVDYLRSTLEHLRDMGVYDPHLGRVWALLGSTGPA
jgi:cation transport protein ChaC